MMTYRSKILTVFFTCLLLSSCKSNLLNKTKEADRASFFAGFERRMVKGGEFWLTTYEHVTNKNLPYVFYIEGDGLAFRGRYTVSDDPTPGNPMLLKLAVLDKRPNVVYIARPCQYTPMDLNPLCNNTYWTDKRLSDEVVTSINEVIETLNNNQPFSLVGFSGGGGIAVLIAARNPHVRDILTLGANLDHIKFNQYHRVKPMLGSLNPIDYAQTIRNIPQLHLSGGRDKIMPPFIADEYVQASNSICVHQQVFTDNDHLTGWEKVWKYVLTIPLACYKN